MRSHKPHLTLLLVVTPLLATACGPFGGLASGPKTTRATPSPSPSPPSPILVPDPFGPPLPPPQGGPLPGQGLPVSGPIPVPLLIQIENTAPSRPQAGLEAASVIFQSLAEGNITRLSVLFHRLPGVVGPVRSARYITAYLAQRFGTEVMCSGGSPSSLSKLTAARIPTMVNDYDNGAHFFRWGGRPAPHNVYTSQAQALAADAVAGIPARADDFARRAPWRGLQPAPVIDVPAHHTGFSYDNGTYRVITEGAPLTDVIFGEVRPVSVAVLHVPQHQVPTVLDVAGNPVMDYNLASGGAAEVYAGGTVIRGGWHTTGATGTIALSDPDGFDILVPRGLLWVSLAP